MSQRLNRHLLEPLGRTQKFSKRLIELARIHLIKAVVAILILSWIGISYVVYLCEAQVKDATITTFGRALWWGIVTVFTVGYGDYTPLTAGGRIWGGGLMFFGVFGVAIITSKISSYFLEQALREGRGVVDSAKLKNHFIVCGWKEELHELLTHILDYDPSLQASDIGLVANLTA
ncbi:MAG: potassium channel family protein, partial [Bdellovibrionota bacterium]